MDNKNDLLLAAAWLDEYIINNCQSLGQKKKLEKISELIKRVADQYDVKEEQRVLMEYAIKEIDESQLPEITNDPNFTHIDNYMPPYIYGEIGKNDKLKTRYVCY